MLALALVLVGLGWLACRELSRSASRPDPVDRVSARAVRNVVQRLDAERVTNPDRQS